MQIHLLLCNLSGLIKLSKFFQVAFSRGSPDKESSCLMLCEIALSKVLLRHAAWAVGILRCEGPLGREEAQDPVLSFES